MCGIVGVYRFDDREVDPVLLQRMTDSIKHRGPDDEGHVIRGNVGLGNRRLSILDLSEHGHQPMCNEDGTIWLTYNGEIYNHRDLRTELIQLGHRFSSQTDSEVLLHLYEEHGEDLLRHLNGMFAFVLWDSNSRKLFAARDRLGIKPFFYYVGNDRFLFGSEIKAILCDADVEREVDLEALHHYLSFNYTPAPLTLFKGVRQLLPGQCLTISSNRVLISEYWDLEYDETTVKSTQNWERSLDELLERSVKRRLISDVPIGVWLSGGLDSSAITHYMAKLRPDGVDTFSIGFEEASYSELGYARLVARQHRTNHHERIVSSCDVRDVIPRLIEHAEEPTADASMVPVFRIAELTKELGLKVILSGDGADELLAGYETYQAYYLARLYRALPEFARWSVIDPLVERLPVSDTKYSFESKAKRFVRAARHPAEVAHGFWRIVLNEEAKRFLYSTEVATQLKNIDTAEQTYGRYFARTNARRPLNRLLYVDTRFYLPNDMLVKVDRMSMAHSLEVRVPFLDHELVEFLATVPPSLKLRWLHKKKYLLKRVMADKLPRKIVRRGKQGFVIPVGGWIRGELRSLVLDALSGESIQRIGLFRADAVNSMLKEHFSGRQDHGYAIWGLLTFALWWDWFIDRKPMPASSRARLEVDG